jgi:hypothetical protein
VRRVADIRSEEREGTVTIVFQISWRFGFKKTGTVSAQFVEL